MCGITGFVNYEPLAHDSASKTLQRMTKALAHRGPDGEGTWLDPESRICLGHRRLSIIDLSIAGAQPMTSASGRYTIVYNGEIYGFRDLRRELESRGVRFRGHSDTEVILAAIEAYGLEATLTRLNGMFAFALYDNVSRQLILARDRLGKKPLYVGVNRNVIAFASELKSLRAHPAFEAPEIDVGALTLFVRHNYIPAPYSIYKNIVKLSPASWIAVSVDQQLSSTVELLKRAKSYWRAFDAAERGHAEPIQDEQKALDLLDRTLQTAVSERLVSDVPLGAFMSGGIDSSLISAIIQEVSAGQLRTFTVRFAEQKYNEADDALEIARALKTDHTELTASPQMAIDSISRLPEIYDEPFADPSQIPTLLVSELARKNVTVAISGDGGDELFAGYSRYSQMMTFDGLRRRIPAFGLAVIDAMPVSLLDTMLKFTRRFVPRTYREEVSGDRIKKLTELLKVSDFDKRYLAFLSQWKSPAKLVSGGYEPGTAMTDGSIPDGLGPIERMMYADTVAYLPDNVLVKVDRASMAVGLEMRSPLLDHRVVEMAWRMPTTLRLANGTSKIALRRLLARRLPEKLFDRPKHGFSAPISDWLRGPLRNWAANMLSPARLRREGIFCPNAIETRWMEHVSGTRNWGPQLWTIIMYNAWSDRWRN